MKNNDFRCPKCKADGTLRPDQGNLKCASCNSSFPVSEGIVSFIEQSIPYTELPLNEFRSIIREMEKRNWRDVVFDRLYLPHPVRWQIMTDDVRADWTFLFDLHSKNVLEIGAGHGTLTERLLHNECSVICVEPTIERLQFIQQRLRQSDLTDNATLVHGTALDLPFADAGFDAATIIGVLEWIPKSIANGNPEDIQ